MKKNLKEYVIEQFSLNATQEWYINFAESGLWESEKILIQKHFKPKSTILDIGCGTGRTTIHLHKLGYQVNGIDIVPLMIKNAKVIAKFKKLNIKYEIGDATDLKYKNSSFDNALFSFNGWTQIPGKNNRLKALKEIYRVLKYDGHFIFTSHIRKMKGFTIYWTKQWIKYYILRPLGFNIREVEYGEYFFDIESTNKSSIHKQYIHMPSLRNVKKQITKVGFNLVYIARSDVISCKKTGEAPPMFYVCKKMI